MFKCLLFSELHDLNRSLGFNARAVARKQRQVLQELKNFTYVFIYFIVFEIEFRHATKFSEVGSFRFTRFLRIARFWFNDLKHEWLCTHNGNFLINSINLVFLKIKVIIPIIFLRFWFSSLLVFVLLHDFDRTICFNIRVVVHKQREILGKLKHFSVSQNKIYHTTEFSEVLLFRCFSVLQNAWF